MILILRTTISFLVILMFMLFLNQPGFANGGKGKVFVYGNRIDFSNNNSTFFKVVLDEKLFLLTSVRNKYKVVRMKIDNTKNGSPIRLSKTEDKIELIVSSRNRVVTGILDLTNHDPAFWDSLDAETRSWLAYPKVVPAREEESIFIFIPDKEIKTIPKYFKFTVSSLPGREVKLRPPPARRL